MNKSLFVRSIDGFIDYSVPYWVDWFIDWYSNFQINLFNSFFDWSIYWLLIFLFTKSWSHSVLRSQIYTRASSRSQITSSPGWRILFRISPAGTQTKRHHTSSHSNSAQNHRRTPLQCHVCPLVGRLHLRFIAEKLVGLCRTTTR